MVFCIIPGCGNTSTRDKGVYSRVPKIVTHCGHQQEEITTRRRTLWLDAIARPDLNENIILSERVCFRHFISGTKILFYFNHSFFMQSFRMYD